MGPATRSSAAKATKEASRFKGGIMGRDVVVSSRQGVVDGESNFAGTTHKKAFQNGIALRLGRLEQKQQFNFKQTQFKEDGGK